MKNYLLLGLILFAGGGVFGDNCENAQPDETHCTTTTYTYTKKGKVYGQTTKKNNCFYDKKNNKCCTQENTTGGTLTTKRCK